MIQLSKNYSLPERDEETIPMKVVGVGGAGCNALDRIVLDGLEKADLIAINTDVQALSGSVAPGKVQLGRTVTRGLGAGGDPEVGYNAAAESTEEIQQALAGARMIFICTGLGGGTGSGAAPMIAQVARESGSLVVGFATMPFSFEGRRRTIQAEEALSRLRQQCDAVICFENDRMGDIVAPKAGIHQAFAVADMTISQSVRSIVNLIQRPGLIRIGFDDLLAALRNPDGRCLFGYGESDSDNRAHDALTLALKNPLMDRGQMLSDAANVLVQIAGGPGMTLAEVESVMKDLGRHISDETQIFFGTVVDSRMGNRLSVTLISSLAAEGKVAAAPSKIAPHVLPEPVAPPEPPIWEHPAVAELPEETAQVSESPAIEEPPETFETEFAQVATPENGGTTSVSSAPESMEAEAITAEEGEEAEEMMPVAPSPAPVARRKTGAAPKEGKGPSEKKVQAKQEVLQFEPVTRGRFEKSEPTIVEGQDLDVPTFLRKNVRVK